MVFLARRIKHPLNAPVKRLHDPDAREHHLPAAHGIEATDFFC
jgi:hypothetical protein